MSIKFYISTRKKTVSSKFKKMTQNDTLYPYGIVLRFDDLSVE